MNIEDANTAQDFWIAMIENAVMRVDAVMTVPATAMTEGAADELAKRLNLSVRAKGTDYVFTNKHRSTVADAARHLFKPAFANN